MTNNNPATQTLDRLRQKAQVLLRAARASDPILLERLGSLPRLSELPIEAIPAAVQLVDCQQLVARDVGAASWKALKEHLENLDPRVIPAEQVLMFLAGGDFNRVRVILSQNDDLGPVNLFVAAAIADVPAVEEFLEDGPPSPRHPRNDWTPLHYLAGAPFHADSPDASDAYLEAARLLLDAGADPNEYTPGVDGGTIHHTPLYRAIRGDNIPLVRLLLERGADPKDGESIREATEGSHPECLELLRDASRVHLGAGED